MKGNTPAIAPRVYDHPDETTYRAVRELSHGCLVHFRKSLVNGSPRLTLVIAPHDEVVHVGVVMCRDEQSAGRSLYPVTGAWQAATRCSPILRDVFWHGPSFPVVEGDAHAVASAAVCLALRRV